MIIFSQKAYDFIKYLCVIGIPAVSTFIIGLGQVFEWVWCEPCAMVLVLVQALLGTLFCIDAAGYNASLADETEDSDEEEAEG